MNEVMIMGIRLSPLPSGLEAQKAEAFKLITSLASKVFNEVVPVFTIFIRKGTLRGTLLPPVEVKFTCIDDADTFRRGSSQRVKILIVC